MSWIHGPLVLELETGRVSLRPLRPSHAADIYQARGDGETWSYMPTRLLTPEDADTLIERALAAKAAGTEYPFVIFDRLRNRVVGSTRYLDLSQANRSLEIGWTWIEPEARRTSVNTECKLLLLTHAFELLDCERVQIKTDARNVRSQRAIERVGFVKEGVLRRHRVLPDGFVRDSVYYSLIRGEWPEMKRRFGGLLREVPTGSER